MGTTWGTLVKGLLTATLFLPLVASQSSLEGRADLEYGLGSSAAGRVEAACEGRALLFPRAQAGSLVVESAGGTFRYFQTWENHTVLLGGLPGESHVIPDQPDSQSESREPVPAGRLRVEWTNQGSLVVFGREALTRRVDSFPVELQVARLQAGPLSFEIPTGHHWMRNGSVIYEYRSGIPGWARTLQVDDGRVAAHGNLTLYLEGATVRGGDGFERTVPPWKEEYAHTPSRAAGVWTHRYHHALVELTDARLELTTGAVRPVCRGLSNHVVGTFTAHQSRGHFEAGGTRVEVDRRVVELQGDFQYDEAPSGDPPYHGGPVAMRLQGSGSFRAVGVDFALVAEDPSYAWGAAGALAVGAVAAGGFAVWKLLGFLFTRLRQERLLSSSTRRRLFEAIDARPGITIRELRSLSNLGDSTVRYQLGVLERHRLVRSFRLRGADRYAPTGRPVEELRRDRLLAVDSKVAALVARVGLEGTLAGRVLRELCAEWGITRAGGWRVIERAVQAQLLRKELRGREAWLCPAS